MADFPATKKTFTQAVDGTTFLEAILFNTGYNEVEALETFIGALGAGNSQSYSTSLNDCLVSTAGDAKLSISQPMSCMSARALSLLKGIQGSSG